MRLSIAILASIALLACSEKRRTPTEPDLIAPANLQWADVGSACTVDAPAVTLPQALRDSLPAPTYAYADVVWADLARTVPGGWGGFFRVENVPTMYMVDTTQLANAIVAINAAGVGMAIPAQTIAVRGRWDFAQLHDWNRYLQPRSWSGTNMTMADVQELRNRIEYYVRDEASRPLLEARLRQLGAPACLVAIGIASPSVAR